MKQSRPKQLPKVYNRSALGSLARLVSFGHLIGKSSGLKIGGSVGNKHYRLPHQSAREKARNACGRVIQYVKPVWGDCNDGRFTGKGKRTESRRQ